MQNATKKEWEKQVHAVLHMTRPFTRDEKRYPLSKWYETGVDVETIEQAYKYVCSKPSSSGRILLDRASGWNFLDRVLVRIKMHRMTAAKEDLVSLAEYAKLNGVDPATVRQRVHRGAYLTARKIGRNWVIDKNEPHQDHRIRSGQYAKKINNEEE